MSRTQDMINSVNEIFAAASEQTQNFAKRAGIACQNGCGKCCESPSVEATILEMLPMAQEIVATGDAGPWLTRLRDPAIRFRRVCPIYQQTAPGAGRCSHYQTRPLTCRLFGYAATHSKNSPRAMVTCSVLFSQITDDFSAEAPLCEDFGQRLSAVDPGPNARRLPIVDALREAIEKCLFEQELLQARSHSGSQGDEPHPS